MKTKCKFVCANLGHLEMYGGEESKMLDDKRSMVEQERDVVVVEKEVPGGRR